MKFYVEIPEIWALESLEGDEMCDGYWISSLTQSWQKGYPDNCTLPWTNYVDITRRLRQHTKKPIIVDVDMLFNEPSIGALICSELFHAGCNQVVIESKRFPKVNSLIPDKMVLSTPEEFSRMINKVKKEVPQLIVTARLEYLAQTKNVDETVNIASRVIDAGADNVVVHWGGNDETDVLKDTLKNIKEKNIEVGIIPTKFLDEVRKGDFDDLADFSILGNITSSFIRNAFIKTNIRELLELPCDFKPLLNWASQNEPIGHTTLIVLGARPDKNSGKYFLEKKSKLMNFKRVEDHFYQIIFVTSGEYDLDLSDFNSATEVKAENSIGEVHSLSCAIKKINTENSVVAYADIEEDVFTNIKIDGLGFRNDKFIGVMGMPSETLFSLCASSSPEISILEMASSTNLSNIFFNS